MSGRFVEILCITMRKSRILLRVMELVNCGVLILSVAASFLQNPLPLDPDIIVLRRSVRREHPQAQVTLLDIHHLHECQKRECEFGMLGLSSEKSRSLD